LKRKKIADNRKHPSIRTNKKQAEERAKTRCKNKAATSETETEPLPTPKKEEETLKKRGTWGKKKVYVQKCPKIQKREMEERQKE
jgi:hypothetical protein